jgi:hypothetical protein
MSDTMIGLLVFGAIFVISVGGGKLLVWAVKGKLPGVAVAAALRVADPLDRPFLRLAERDCLRVRNLLESITVQGRAGSGKSSGPGLHMAKALARDPRISTVILCSKPEDRRFFIERYREAGRLDKLVVFGPRDKARFALLEYEQACGADSREMAGLIMTCGESLGRDEGGGGGREDSSFWRRQAERKLQMAIEPVRLALGKIDPMALQRFIAGAAQTPAQLNDPQWRKGFHNTVMERADQAPKTAIEQADFQQVVTYWLLENPNLNDKTRSCMDTEVFGVLHAMCSGVVRELLATTSTVTPKSLDKGVSWLIDMPVSRWGASGGFLNAAIKLAVQRHVLRRHVGSDKVVICLFSDEFQNHVNSFDAKYLAECRSHLGCMIVLTQSLHSFFAAIKGGSAGEHAANALLTNFGTKLFCVLGDAKSAEAASGLAGREREVFVSCSTNPNVSMTDQLWGHSNITASSTERYEPVLQPREFLTGLRTGGPECGYMVDCWCIRNGQLFSNGKPYLFTTFSQRG